MMARPGGRAPSPRASSDRLALLSAGVAFSASLLVVLAYAVRAAVLIAYPWDWSPDEGLSLDYARRLLEAPGTLYPRQVVPFPSAYGPLLPLALAPLTLLGAPLSAARVLALVWTLLGAAALGGLVHRRAGWTWAAAGVALYLAGFDVTFWSMLVRPDGPMLALWLGALAVLLPRRLERGGDRLSTRRLWAGTALLLAAVLVKVTAVLHGAPLVLGWFLVDRRSGWRLTTTMALSGFAVLVALQVATHGGFLWVNSLWAHHPQVAGQAPGIFLSFLLRGWPVLALAVVGGILARAARVGPWREPAILALVGGLTVLPLLGKYGASWNYLLPLHAALVIAFVCWCAAAVATWPRQPWIRHGAPLLTAVLALALAATSTFPLPTAHDAAAARAFYGFSLGVVRQAGGPLLAARPELLYYLAGQPVEIEGSSAALLAASNAPGREVVLERVRDRTYTLVVETWPISDAPEFREALLAGYRHVGSCALGSYFGPWMPSHIFLRRDLTPDFTPAASGRCAPVARPADR